MHTNPEVLALLALGEDSATPDERDHVNSCEICTREVAELAHLAGVGRTVKGAAPLEAPRPEVWERIRAEIGFGAVENGVDGVHAPRAATESTVADLSERPRPAAPPPSQPDQGTPASNGNGPAESGRRSVPRGRRILALALAAVIALIVGVGIGLGWSALSRPAPTVIGEAQLDAKAESWAGSTGEAVLERNQAGQEILVVRMTTPRPVPAIRQVWMMDEAGKAMIAVGIITGDQGEWTVPLDAETQFPVIDVSEEPRDGVPTHSGISIVRGTLNV